MTTNFLLQFFLSTVLKITNNRQTYKSNYNCLMYIQINISFDSLDILNLIIFFISKLSIKNF